MKNAASLFAMSLFAGLAFSSPGFAADNVIQVSNWNDYVDERVIEEFTAQTGIKVEYTTFENDEDGVALISQPGMDVVSPPTVLLSNILQRGLLQPFASAEMKDWADTHPLIMQRVRLRDTTAAHVMPYLWGRIGLVVDTAKVEQALGREIQPSWDLVFNKDDLEKLSSCGVSILDSPNDILNIYSLYRGRMIDRISEREVNKFKSEMAELAPLYSAIDSTAYLDQLPQGNLCVAMVWEGDGRSLQDSNDNLALLMPVEGTALFMDNMAIPTASDNPEGARKYIEFMSRPENSMRNAEYTGYNSPSSIALTAMAKKNPDLTIDMAEVPVFLPNTPTDSLYRDVTNHWAKLIEMTGSQIGKKASAPEAQASAGKLAGSDI